MRAWMLLGQGISLLIQAVYFVIIARSLGAQQYGAFVAATAFTQILSPFVGFGRIDLLIKNVARDGDISGLPGQPAVYDILPRDWPRSDSSSPLPDWCCRPLIPLLVIVLVSLAELIFNRLIDSSAVAFQAIDRLDVTAQLRIWPTLARLVGIVALAASLEYPTARHWSFVYCPPPSLVQLWE